jgi:hypothetical protein
MDLLSLGRIQSSGVSIISPDPISEPMKRFMHSVHGRHGAAHDGLPVLRRDKAIPCWQDDPASASKGRAG